MAEIKVFLDRNCSKSLNLKSDLQANGNILYCSELSSHCWTREKLLPFVRGRQPVDIMNTAAPEIVCGEIDPVLLTFDEAVDLMVASKGLIRGPLIVVGGMHIQGVHDQRLQSYLASKTFNTNQVVREIRPEKYAVARSTERLQQFFSTMISHGIA